MTTPKAAKTPKKEAGRIVSRGMGGFLNPPTHPEHNFCVETDLRRRPQNRGSMSLTAAVSAEWLDDATRAAAKALLDDWSKKLMSEGGRPYLGTAEVEDWVHQILGYFRTGYRNPNAPEGQEWHAQYLVFDNERDPIAHADEHAGVHHIRKFYPAYEPSREDFEKAYWGSRPEGQVH